MAKEILFAAADGTHGYELWETDGTLAGTSLLMDINPGSGGSLPRYFTVLGNGKVVFEANDGTHGDELWVTDGTAAGTAMVEDINPASSTFLIHSLTALGNGKAIFSDNDGTHGSELWVTDGTAAGTSLVKDINPGSGNSDPGYFSRVAVLGNGTAVFSANDGTHGYELWVTDGTAAGTSLVMDINPGSAGSAPQDITAIGNGKALFLAKDGTHGYELWVTDGTAPGTSLVKDIYPGSFGSYPFHFTLLGNGKVLFAAADAAHGDELWVTDGTSAGTALVKDIYPGLGSSYPFGFTDLGNGKALFAAIDATHGAELWVTDGTAAGTALVKDIYPGSAGSTPQDITAIGNGKALFQATDAAHGTELWISDGTAGGTALVKDINPGSNSLFAYSSDPRYFTALGNGTVLFTADDGTHGGELWVTDGTAAGTMLEKDINPGSGTANPNGFTTTDITAPVQKEIIFSAKDGTHGYELWGTDGTAAGTVLIKDINPGSADSLARYFTVLGNGKVVFEANDGTHGDELWVTDGTAAGTTMVKDINPGTSTFLIHSITALGNGKAIFSDNDGTHGSELWVTDGTAAGTSLVKDINPGANDSNPGKYSRVAVLGSGKAVFSANDGTHGDELWVTDGTAAGTTLVKDIDPGSSGSAPQQLTAMGNGKALFQADDGVHGGELWVTDGTAAGTYMVKDIKTVGFGTSYPSQFTVLGNGKVLFDANDGAHGDELWITDGTTAGTALVKDIFPGVGSSVASAPGNMVALGNGKALFSANDGVHGQELWVTDGTAGGTSLVKDVYPGASSGVYPGPDITSIGSGKALFQADDGTHGTELWTSDGTAAGTFMVKDIHPGSNTLFAYSSFPRYFTMLGNGTALFEADDGTHGGELWVTDGTTAGTMLEKDINPGAGTANPNGFTITDITPPAEPQSMLPVAIGGTVTLSADFLTASDPDNTAAELTYTVDSAPSHGVLLLNGAATSTFTQDDIDNNRVQYRENGDLAGRDSFSFTLADPAGNRIGPEPFQIAIVDTTTPVIETNTGLSASPDVPARIWTSSLCTVALGSNPDQVVYRLLTQPAHGELFVNGSQATMFTQADIDDGRVGYVKNGDGAADDGFSFQVSDAAGEQTGVAHFTISVSGESRSDIRLHDTASGSFFDWAMNGAAITTAQNLTFNGAPVGLDTSWVVNGVGDLNGDGDADMLLHSTNGAFVDWTMSGSAITGAQNLTFDGVDVALDSSCWVPGTGDFNGDGATDILLRNIDGSFFDWTMDGSTITAAQNVTFGGNPVGLDFSWSVAAVADFSGDGKADILLQNTDGRFVDWTMNGSSIAAAEDVTFGGNPVGLDGSWSVLGAGDFNGDGKADVLLRDTSGNFADWTMDGASITAAQLLSFQGNPVALDTSWTFADLADYNGDGKADILLRNSNGSFVDWTMNGSTITSADSISFQGNPVMLDHTWQTS